ncbi:hypothetical protein EDB86DRAFT_99708 [Lactarius hatsudake]|nr:hypothetical protein EDB86DRAFT_99708 [Lactarius hatsudake]
MPLPGEWIDRFSPLGDGDAPPQPDSSNNNDIVPRAYHRSENLPLEFWDPRRLAEHASAVMSSDTAPAAVDFIIEDRITGPFLLHYTNQIDEVISGDRNKCELTRRIARIVPFWIPRRREQFTCERYRLPRLVEDLDAKFSLCETSLVAGEEVEEPFDWEYETPSPSTLPSDSDSERPDSDLAEEPGHLLSLVEHSVQLQLEPSFPLNITLSQSSLSQDIFTSPALLDMGFHDFSTASALSQPTAQMPTAHVTRRLAPIRSAENDGRSSGPEAPEERTNHGPEGRQRSRRISAAVAPGCPFLCFGVLLDLSRRFLVPRALAFSQLITNIEETRPDQAELQ